MFFVFLLIIYLIVFCFGLFWLFVCLFVIFYLLFVCFYLYHPKFFQTLIWISNILFQEQPPKTKIIIKNKNKRNDNRYKRKIKKKEEK